MQTPAMLVMGYNPLEPFEAAFRPRVPPNGEEDMEQSKQWANAWVNQQEMQVLRGLVQEFKRSNTDNRNDIVNARRIPTNYKRNDLVLLKHFVKSDKKRNFAEKLSVKFDGPFRVEHHRSPDTLVLQPVRLNKRTGQPIEDDLTKHKGRTVIAHARRCIPYSVGMDSDNDRSRTITLSGQAAKYEIIHEESLKELNKLEDQDPHYQSLRAIQKVFRDNKDKQFILYRTGTHKDALNINDKEEQFIELGKYNFAFLDQLTNVVKIVLQRVALLQLDNSQALRAVFLSSQQRGTGVIENRMNLVAKPVWDMEDGTHQAKQYRAEDKNRVPNQVTICEADRVNKVPFALQKVETQDPVVKKLIEQGDVDAKTLETNLQKIPDEIWQDVVGDPFVARRIKDRILNNDPELSYHTRSRTQQERSRAEESRKNLESVTQGGAEKNRLKREAQERSRGIKRKNNLGININANTFL